MAIQWQLESDVIDQITFNILVQLRSCSTILYVKISILSDVSDDSSYEAFNRQQRLARLIYSRPTPNKDYMANIEAP